MNVENTSTLIFAVEYRYAGEADAMALVRPEHRTFLRGLLATGHLLASGPLPDVPGALIIVRASDAASARDVLASDPFQASGFVSEVLVRRWDPVIGPWA